jgi:hypothetical protein
MKKANQAIVAILGTVCLSSVAQAAADPVGEAMTTATGYWDTAQPVVIGVVLTMVGLAFLNKFKRS